MKALGVTVLRFQRTDQEYKVPLNFRIGGREIPVGLGITTMVLGFVAIANLFTKQIATKYGIAFTLGLFVMFTISEKINLRRAQTAFDRKHNGKLEPGELDALMQFLQRSVK